MAIPAVRFTVEDRETNTPVKAYTTIENNSVFNFLTEGSTFASLVTDAFLYFSSGSYFSGISNFLDGVMDWIDGIIDSITDFIDGIGDLFDLPSSLNLDSVTDLVGSGLDSLLGSDDSPSTAQSFLPGNEGFYERNIKNISREELLELTGNSSFYSYKKTAINIDIKGLYNQLSDNDKKEITINILMHHNNTIIKNLISKKNFSSDAFFSALGDNAITDFDKEDIYCAYLAGLIKIGHRRKYTNLMPLFENKIKDPYLRGVGALIILKDAAIHGDYVSIIDIGKSSCIENIKYISTDVVVLILEYLKLDDKLNTDMFDHLLDILLRVNDKLLISTNDINKLTLNNISRLSMDSKNLFNYKISSIIPNIDINVTTSSSDIQHIHAALEAKKFNTTLDYALNSYLIK